MLKNLLVKKSCIGRGIFAQKNFRKGSILFQVTGTFTYCYEDGDLDEKTRANTYRFDEERYLNPAGTIGDFLNHSCEPNARVVKTGNKLWVKALAPVLKGSEVTIDYSTIIANDDTWTLRCECGNGKCRKLIGKFKNLPKKLRDRYLLKGMVPEYVVK